MRLVLVLPFALVGCAQIGASPKQFPLAFEGKFEFKMQGSASAIGELAKAQSAGEKKVSLSFSTKGDFRVDKYQGGYVVTLSHVDAGYLDGDRGVDVFASPQSWMLCLPSGSDLIMSEANLEGEKLLVSRLFKSYWRSTLGPTSRATEVELDGLNTVTYPSKAKRTWLGLQSQTASLAELPNRSAIAIDARVSGEIRYSGDQTPSVIEGTKWTKHFMSDREVGSSSLSLKLTQNPTALRETKYTKYRYQYPLIEVATNPFGERELQLKNLGQATPKTIYADLAKPTLDIKDRNRLFLQLRALVYLHPEQCPSIIARATNTQERMLAAEALAGIASPPAQEALLKLLQRSKANEQYDSMLALLIPITKLEPPLLAYLTKSAFENSNVQQGYTAQLILGSNIRRSVQVNKSQAKSLSNALEAHLRSAKSVDLRINLLYAMGNAGNPELAPSQASYLGSSSPRLRSAAVHSLRHLPAEFVKLTLDEFAPKETDPEVLKEIESMRAQIKEQNP